MAVYKNKNTWFFRTYVTDNLGHRKQIYKSGFASKSIAKLEEQQYILQYKKIVGENILFSDLYEQYKTFKSQTIKPQSFITICNKIENHILPYFKDYKIKEINHIVYINWKKYILQKKYSFKYMSSLHICMVNILNYAMQYFGLENNVASKTGNFININAIKKYDYWTFEEFYTFINKVNEIEYKVLFRVLFFTGMRLGECLALNWEDIKSDYISINKTIAQKVRTNGNYIVTTPKSLSSNRVIKLDKETIYNLNLLKRFYSQFIGFNNNWYIFGGIKPLATTTISRKKNYYCDLAKVKRIKIHEFRHSHASLLISKGIPITMISARLGHKDVSMTLKVYSHLIPHDEEKIINLINQVEERN